MTIGIAKPFESLRAVLVIEDAEEDSGQFGPQYDGAVFTDWLSLDEHSGNIKPRSKAWQVVEAVLGEVPRGLEAEDLVGGKFAAQVGLNKKKTHSKVVHDTISPAPRRKAARETAPEIDESEFDDIPFGNV